MDSMEEKKSIGRPPEGRVKVNLLLTESVRDRIDAQIEPGNPAKSSRGKVVETKFQEEQTHE